MAAPNEDCDRLVAPESVTIRPLEPEDIPAYSALKLHIFGPRRAEAELLRHRYFGAPAELMPGVAVLSEGRLLGGIATTSRRFQVDDDVAVSAAPVDMMLVKEARGRVIRRKMTAAWMELVHPRRPGVAYGMGNRLSRTDMLGHDRHWEPGFDVRTWVRVVRPRLAIAGQLKESPMRRRGLRLALEAARLAVPPRRSAPGWQVELTDRLPEDIDSVWPAQAARHRFQTVRDHAYFSWRFGDQWGSRFRWVEARREGRLRGALVYADETVNGVRTFVAADWTLEELPVLDLLLDAVVAEAKATEGVAGILLAALPGEGSRAQLRGFLPVPQSLTPYDMPVNITKGSIALHPSLPATRAWHFTHGDLDVV